MAEKPKTYTIDLNRGAARLLTFWLGQPGWYKDQADAYRAGALLEGDTIEVGRLPNGADGKTSQDDDVLKPWFNQGHPAFELTEKQRDTVKRCLDHWIKAGALPLSAYSVRLQRAFGLTPEE